ncbi:MAG: polysaccharide biosynthesis C-terminal domain-containing protein [Pyrinomonadaceae bacterium]|nr:polysaccharide biosynthesis C-terminal domain-containing protein [Pyrinomonadaceae bacterium]
MKIESAKRQTFSSQVVWTLLARVLMAGASVGTSLIVARWLGAEGLGQFAVLNVTAAIAVQAGCAGMPLAGTYFIAQNRTTALRVWANAFLFSFVAGGALALVIGGLATMNPQLFGDIPLPLVAAVALSVPFQLANLFALHILLGIEAISRFNLLEAASPLLMFLNAIVVLMLAGGGLLALLATNTAALASLTLLSVWVIRGSTKHIEAAEPMRLDGVLFRRMARYSLKFYILMLAPAVLFRSDLLIVKYFRTAAEAGVYSVAAQVATMLMLVPLAISTVLFPRVAADDDAEGDFACKVTRHATFVILLLCAATVPLGFALPVIYGADFAAASVQLFILLPGVFLIGIQSVLVQHLNATDRTNAIPLFWITTLAVNISINLALVPRYGARGAALSSTVSYALIFLLIVWRFQSLTKKSLSAILLLRRTELSELLNFGRLPASPELKSNSSTRSIP